MPDEMSEEFDDVQRFGTIMEYTKFRDKTFWESIGVGGSLTANPVEYNGRVYFGSYDKNFYCLDLDGNEVWMFATNGIIQSFAACKDGRVYFCSGDSNVYCLEAETGRLVWKFGASGPIGNGPTEDNGVLYVGSNDGKLYAISTDKGGLLWSFKTSYPMATPLVLGDKIYCGYLGSCLYCLSLKGELLWKFNASAWIAAWPPAYDSGSDTIYFGSAGKNLYAISPSGSLKWKKSFRDTVLCPVVDDGRVYFGCLDRKAYCLDSKGRMIWSFRASDVVSEITIDGGIAYMGCYDNKVYALGKESGNLIWSFKTNGFVHCKPLICGGKIMFGSFDCNFYCLDKLTGELLWKFSTSIGTPSPIHPPEQLEVKELSVVVPQEDEDKKKEKYKPGEAGSEYEADMTTYVSGMSKTYVSGKKKGYMSSSEF